LLSSADSIKGFCAPLPALPVRRLGVPKALGGDTTATADSPLPEGRPTVCHAGLSSEAAGVEVGSGLAGPCLGAGEQLLSCASLVWLGL